MKCTNKFRFTEKSGVILTACFVFLSGCGAGDWQGQQDQIENAPSGLNYVSTDLEEGKLSSSSYFLYRKIGQNILQYECVDGLDPIWEFCKDGDVFWMKEATLNDQLTDNVDKKISDIKSEIQRLEDEIIKSTITAETFKEKVRQYNEEIDKQSKAIQSLNNSYQKAKFSFSQSNGEYSRFIISMQGIPSTPEHEEQKKKLQEEIRYWQNEVGLTRSKLFLTSKSREKLIAQLEALQALGDIEENNRRLEELKNRIADHQRSILNLEPISVSYHLLLSLLTEEASYLVTSQDINFKFDEEFNVRKMVEKLKGTFELNGKNQDEDPIH